MRLFRLYLRFSGFFLAGVFGLFLVIYLSYLTAYQNKLYPGVIVAGIHGGNKSLEETNALITPRIDRYVEQGSLTLTYDGGTYSIPFNSIGVAYSPDQTVQRAYAIGRGNGIFQNFLAQFSAWKQTTVVDPVFTFDEQALARHIASLSASLNVAASDAQLTFDNKEPRVSQHKKGRKVNEVFLRQEILKHLSSLSPEPISVTVDEVEPGITYEEALGFVDQVKPILKKKIVLSYDNRQWTAGSNELARMITLTTGSFSNDAARFGVGIFRGSFSFIKASASQNSASDAVRLGLSENALNDFVSSIARDVDISAQDAVFQFTNNRVTVFQASRDGVAVDQSRLRRLVEELVFSEASTAATMPVPVSVSSAKVTTESVNNLGIKELVGRGVSYFAGSLPGREFNIEHGAKKFHGVLIPPGATFSFNDTIGDVSDKTGFQAAYIIKDGKTDWGIGGGVCQISTTLYRAALNAGLPIVERHPHSYRVHYYEENSPVGLDASVFAPSWDLKFVNDTPAYLLIQLVFDRSKKMAAFELYGTSDGRVTTISNPLITKQVAAPPPLYQDDPTLPKGTIKQVDFAVPGADVTVNRKVVRNGQLLQNDTIFSHYSAWKAIYLTGTKE